VICKTTTFNQNNQVVQTLTAKLIVFARAGEVDAHSLSRFATTGSIVLLSELCALVVKSLTTKSTKDTKSPLLTRTASTFAESISRAGLLGDGLAGIEREPRW